MVLVLVGLLAILATVFHPARLEKDVSPSANGDTPFQSPARGKRYRDNHDTVISVHPGPSRPLYLCGAKLVGYISMGALMDHLGLNHTATIYDGKVTIAAVCDRRMMPDRTFYYDSLPASFDALSAASRAAARR